MLFKSVTQTITQAKKEFGTSKDKTTIIVAVSGGEDSVVLLDALCSLRNTLRLELVIAHVDHGLRATSERDARFVKKLANKLGLPFYFHKAPNKPANENLEAWARNVRYEFFTSLIERIEADMIVTAHHLQDRAETLLFRLFTGRIATSACTTELIDSKRKVVRPLLNISQEEITTYRKEKKLEFVFDETNDDLDRTRNNIRHNVIPFLAEHCNPSIITTLSFVADRFADDDKYLEKLAQIEFESVLYTNTVSYFKSKDRAIGWRVLRLLAKDVLGEVTERIGYKAYQRALSGILDESGEKREFELGFGCSLICDNKLILFVKKDSKINKQHKKSPNIRNISETFQKYLKIGNN